METVRGTRSVPGLIDTLGAGFESVNRILWILVFPIALDVLLLAAPRLSIRGLVDGWFASLSELMTTTATDIPIDESVDQNRLIVEQLQVALSEGNLLGTLARTVVSVPSLDGGWPIGNTSVVEVTSGGAAALLFVALNLVGMLLGAVYYGLIAQQVRDGQLKLAGFGRRITWYWLSFLGFLGLMLGVSIVIGTPTMLVVVLLMLVAPVAGLLVWQLVTFSLLLFFAIYLFFVLDAIVISEVGPIRAARNSIKLVHQNFWPAIGFIVVSVVIGAGTTIIWGQLGQQPLGVAISIVGNAYIASGLAAASMCFYRNRLSPS